MVTQCTICQHYLSAKLYYNFIIAVRNLRQFSVQSSFNHNLPTSLVIPSCNLELGKSIGQGTQSLCQLALHALSDNCLHLHPLLPHASTCFWLSLLWSPDYVGEFGIVYRGKIKNGFADKSSQAVAVKTLKGIVIRVLWDTYSALLCTLPHA